MYSDWASLTTEIQTNSAAQSVLSRFNYASAKNIIQAVVKDLKTFGSKNALDEDSNCLRTEAHVDWTMQSICYGLTLPSSDVALISDCVNIYCEWINCLCYDPVNSSACEAAFKCIPMPLLEEPNKYFQIILSHLINLFKQRDESNTDFLNKHVSLCNRVLRAIQAVTLRSNNIDPESWTCLLKFLLMSCDILLSIPSDKDTLGNSLCNVMLSVLFETWLLACSRDSFPSPSLWKTLQEMVFGWRHLEPLITQWHLINRALTNKLLKILYGTHPSPLHHHKDPLISSIKSYEEDEALIPGSISNETVIQCWFRFLHLIGSPVDLSRPHSISNNQRFMHMALTSPEVIDPHQLDCLKKLPSIFLRAMKSVSFVADAFLGVSQKDPVELDWLSSLVSVPEVPTKPPPSPVPLRKPRVSVFLPHIRASKESSSRLSFSETSTPKPPPLKPPPSTSLSSSSLHAAHDSGSLSLFRPRVNSLLHLLGTWLFEASLIGVSVHEGTRREVDTEDWGHSTEAYEAGRAQACGALCRIFTSVKTNESILPLYISRFYACLYYGLRVDQDSPNISAVMMSILLNSSDLFRVDLVGVQVLVPHFLAAFEFLQSRLKYSRQEGASTEDMVVRRASVHLLLSLLPLPLHLRDVPVVCILDDGKAETADTTSKSVHGGVEGGSGETSEGGGVSEGRKDAENELKEVKGGVGNVSEYERKVRGEDNRSEGVDEKRNERKSVVTFESYGERLNSLLLQMLHKEQDPSICHMLIGGMTLVLTEMCSYSQACKCNTEPGGLVELYKRSVDLICERLNKSWSFELTCALSSMEALQSFACLHPLKRVAIKKAVDELTMEDEMMELNNGVLESTAKKVVVVLCDFVLLQCSKPAPAHSKDMHSSIVSAYHCLKVWLTQHDYLATDPDILHTLMQVVELGISGSKSQSSASDVPLYKGDKELKPVSLRVKDAAEALLNVIIDHVGSFPHVTGPASLCPLIDEHYFIQTVQQQQQQQQSETSKQQQQQDLFLNDQQLPPPPQQPAPQQQHKSPPHFQYFAIDGSIIIGLLEPHLEAKCPCLIAIVRSAFGRRVWRMRLKHLEKKAADKQNDTTAFMSDSTASQTTTTDTTIINTTSNTTNNTNTTTNTTTNNITTIINTTTNNTTTNTSTNTTTNTTTNNTTNNTNNDTSNIFQKVDLKGKLPSDYTFDAVFTDSSIPRIEDTMLEHKEQLDRLKLLCQQQARLEQQCYQQTSLNFKPTPKTTMPKAPTVFNAVRLFFSHFGFLSLDKLKTSPDKGLPSVVRLQGANLSRDIGLLDAMSLRTADTVHVCVVKSGQSRLEDILANTAPGVRLDDSFGEFIHSLGWPVDVATHPGWTGDPATSWKCPHELEGVCAAEDGLESGDEEFYSNLYDGSSRVLYWSDVSTEVVFVIPSTSSVDPTLLSELERKASANKLPSTTTSTTTASSATTTTTTTASSATTTTDDSGRKRRWTPQADTQVLVVWLECFEDHLTFPTNDFLRVQGSVKGGEEWVGAPNRCTIFIHPLKTALYRIHVNMTHSRLGDGGPLSSGMVVSKWSLGHMVRHTTVNIFRRKTLDNENHQPPHVRRRICIKELVHKHHRQLSEAEFLASLFHCS